MPKIYPAMHFEGLIVAISTFMIIGLFHPLVIKTEYFFGTRPWYIFLIMGIICITFALTIENVTLSALLGVTGASCLWSIGELFAQRRRVERGWFPKREKKKDTPSESQQGL